MPIIPASMAHGPSLHKSLEGIEPFPLQGFNEKSQHLGKFSIASPETDEQHPLVTATKGDIVSTTWFTSPVSSMLKAI